MVIALPGGTVLAASVVMTCTAIHKPMTAYAFVHAIVGESAASTCSPAAEWLWYLLPAPVLGGFMLPTGSTLKGEHKARADTRYDFR